MRVKVFITVIILIFLLLKGCDKSKGLENTIKSLSTEVESTRDELGREASKSSTLLVTNKRQLLRIESGDSIIIELQNTVKSYKGKLRSAIILHNTTSGEVTTNTIIEYDTINNRVYPVYKGTFNTKWYKGSVIACKDSVFNNYKVINKYRITEGKETNKWFKKKTYKTSILNLNPNTETTELKQVTITQNPKRVSLGLQIGYGINLLTFKPVPYLGAGIQINLIGVK